MDSASKIFNAYSCIEIYSRSNSYMWHGFSVRTCTIPPPKQIVSSDTKNEYEPEHEDDGGCGLNESIIIK